jgi:hypothetical protein
MGLVKPGLSEVKTASYFGAIEPYFADSAEPLAEKDAAPNSNATAI